jgi:hypothetical protein
MQLLLTSLNQPLPGAFPLTFTLADHFTGYTATTLTLPHPEKDVVSHIIPSARALDRLHGESVDRYQRR